MKKGANQLYYPEYLQLDRLLTSQSLKSVEAGRPAHDEMLFIVVHQAYELWFKQILFEIGSVIEVFKSGTVPEKEMRKASDRLHRVTEIQKLLIQQLGVLETMTPLDFLDFRDILIPASGFQSVQFRLLENRLGLRAKRRSSERSMPFMDRLSPDDRKAVEASLEGPTLLELVERWLERTPFLEFGHFSFLEKYRSAVETMLEQDRRTIESAGLTPAEAARQLEMFEGTMRKFEAIFDRTRYEALLASGERTLSYKATLAALFIQLYRDEPILHLPFRFLGYLVDIDELLSSWRHGHAMMVHRMIGTKIGTGGTSTYIKESSQGPSVFGDLADLSTYLIPRSALPKLPADAERRLGYQYTSEG